MGFRSLDFRHLARFNSAVSSEFLEFYESAVDTKILNKLSEPPSKFIAPSGLRCPRSQWFRLRGTEPDRVESADRALDFTAVMGTACHRMIQSVLRTSLGDNWISVSDYLDTHDIGHTYILNEVDDGLETQVELTDIPIRFACDGVIKWGDKYYLIEIKSSDHASFVDLTDPKPEHVAQIKCYSSLLKINNVIVIYIDRQYGDVKCYEEHVSEIDMDGIEHTINGIIEAVNTNIAPDRLPVGDAWCSPNRCKFYKKCKQWG